MCNATLAIHMPQPLYKRLQRLATLTQRPLESLVLQALEINIPPLLEDMPEPIRQDLAALERLDDETLRHVAQEVWNLEQNAQYTELLEKERVAMLTPSEKTTLEALYHEANCLMLRKAYANALLKWRGYQLPSLADLESIS